MVNLIKKKSLTIFIFLSLFSQSSYALKYTIFTDQEDQTKAQEVVDEMKKTYPFTAFNVEFEIVQVPSDKLDCESKNGIDRLVACDNTSALTREAARRGGDQVMVVKKMDKWGGSAAQGGIPVITTGTAARAMIHEYMHVLGICDEYEYKETEADFYCDDDIKKPNAVAIKPLANGYSGDPHARSEHGKNIPWFGQIKTETAITQNSGTTLGTGSVDFSKLSSPNYSDQPLALSEPTGLYRGKMCNKARTPIPVWHPGGSATIMENTAAGLGAPLEGVVYEILKSKGARRKIAVQNIEEEYDAVELVKPDVAVNNTGRNIFKSFFDWIADLFENISKSISR